MENYSKVIKKDEFGKAFPEVMYYMDELSGDASAVALYLLAKETSRKVKVVLSGEGADEVFGGYNIYKAIEEKRGQIALSSQVHI